MSLSGSSCYPPRDSELCLTKKRQKSDLNIDSTLNTNKKSLMRPSIHCQSDDANTSSSSCSNSSKSQHIKRNDGRKLNKGSFQRKSYSTEVKKRAIALRDTGLRIESIAKILNTAKSNVEKWCSMKVTM